MKRLTIGRLQFAAGRLRKSRRSAVHVARWYLHVIVLGRVAAVRWF